MHLLIFVLSLFFFTSARAMGYQDDLELLWNQLTTEADQWEEAITNKETTPEQTMDEFASQHALKNSSDLLRLLKENIFHNGIFLWCISKGYRLMTVKRVGALLRKKIGEGIISQKQFEAFVAFHNSHPLNSQEVESQTVRYMNKLFAKTYEKIQTEVSKEKPKHTRKKGIHKRIPAAKKLIENNSLEFHFALCESADGNSILVPQPPTAPRKRGTPKSLEQIVRRNT